MANPCRWMSLHNRTLNNLLRVGRAYPRLANS
nr:MAG TPA_asm: hypothetical protein [Caudoviricetes sp.]